MVLITKVKRAPRGRNDVIAWFVSGKSSGSPWPFLPILLVLDFLIIPEALHGGLTFGGLFAAALLTFFTLIIALSCFVPLLYRPEPSPYLGEDLPLFDLSLAAQKSESAVPMFAGSWAVMLRAPSTDPERLIRDLSEVAAISPEKARIRVLGDVQDVTSYGTRVAARMSALVFGPGQVLVASIDEETAGIIAARLSGPWAQIEVVDGASQSVDDEAPRLSHGSDAPAAPIPAELREFGSDLAAASDEQERRGEAGLPRRQRAGWATIAFVGLVLTPITLSVAGNGGDGAWLPLIFWLVWGHMVYKRLTYRPGDLGTADLIRAARPTVEWLGEEETGSPATSPAGLCTVRLWGVGPRPGDVVMAIGEMSGMSASEARRLCHEAASEAQLTTGVPVVEAVSPEAARDTVNALTAAGASVSVIHHG